MVPDLKTIEEAHERIKPYIHRTPVTFSQSINRIANAELFFKCENFQRVGAFKFRGASNAIFGLSDEEKAKGVATHSSGNHAQAVALAALMNNIPAYIVMPSNAPGVKKRAVAGYSGKIIECEPTLQARESTLAEVIGETGATEVHPYDDYRIIAGQATCAKEMIEDTVGLNSIIAPVGGGGLLSGTLLATNYLSPNTKVYAGEPEGAADAYWSLQEGRIIPPVKPNTIADGLLTALGKRTFPIIKEHVTEIITVSDDEIVEAMRLLWERMKLVVEPSGAVPLAAFLKRKEEFADQKVGIILSGGNVDLNNLPF